MIGILNLWRQFGRRYFWHHLLLGMVAASLGLPASQSQDTSPQANASAISRQSVAALNLTDLVALKDARRRSSFSADYWHQHAIRTVIRHLSFALTAPQTVAAVAEADVDASPHHHQALLETLNALLTREIAPLAPVILAQSSLTRHDAYQTGLWLSQTRGIRAGPLA